VGSGADAAGLPSLWHHPYQDDGVDAAAFRLLERKRSAADAMKLGFHCARTHWIRGFMTFQLVWRTQNVMLTVLV
jgi:hypothetical protein